MAIVAYLTAGMVSDSAAGNPWLKPARKMLLPGATTDAHYQIELACTTCHRDPFGGKDGMQEACMDCHGAALKQAEDSHPTSKFLDPRNAPLAEKLDAALCVTCHAEHRPQITSAMALSVPVDVCVNCHADIAEERPTHAGMTFSTCASSGCHNFHDNSALYEDFLLRHLEDVPTRPGTFPARDFAGLAGMLPDYPSQQYPLTPLQGTDKDAPAEHASADVVAEWSASSHAAAGVNCSGCHGGGPASQTSWNSRPDHTACASCHAQETGGFLSGKHGMRLAQQLPAMSPGLARLPMRAEAHDRELGCSSCHGAHSFDTRRAAVQACLGCHDDEHTLAYRSSAHFRLWQAELDGSAPGGSGVSCASCHLPRIEHRDAQFDLKRTLVQHNQSDTLRPNEKMVRTVCLACHGLQHSLDALADEKLIEKNFAGPPGVRVRSPDLADRRRKDQEAQRRATRRTATEDAEDGDEAAQ